MSWWLFAARIKNFSSDRWHRITQVNQFCSPSILTTAHFSLICQINCVKQLHHLPELAALQSDLLRIGSLISDCRAQSIAQVLQNIPAGGPAFLYQHHMKTTLGLLGSNLDFLSSPSGCQKKMLVGRVERFIRVWNSLRADVANNGKVQKSSRASRCFRSKCKCACVCLNTIQLQTWVWRFGCAKWK